MTCSGCCATSRAVRRRRGGGFGFRLGKRRYKYLPKGRFTCESEWLSRYPRCFTQQTAPSGREGRIHVLCASSSKMGAGTMPTSTMMSVKNGMLSSATLYHFCAQELKDGLFPSACSEACFATTKKRATRDISSGWNFVIRAIKYVCTTASQIIHSKSDSRAYHLRSCEHGR
jgi:hypothetical protein